ncbi:D-alanyl-D-alanine carboxypeptidase family protein [Thermovenabulum gondwanense]|uniref:serine-type D-Ala-D-Ala carboxypeptidase n=1 Tax=Thermovenabulum gondwanense TaxID=520767 RepID=A0A162MGL6_9FIRM|nr:D-alanyl-D-alanine carboxypeptidase DacF [Thermovenabulum gondwanense]
MKNKVISLILVILISIFLFSSTCQAVMLQSPPNIKSPSAILIDASSGKILYEKNAHQKLEPASLAKIMTLLVAFESVEKGKSNFNDEVRVSERAWKTGGSQVFLGPGEVQTLETLLKCIVISSANDASVAVAEHIGGSVEGFVRMMNDKAKELGLQNTNFTNPHGLPDPNLYTTAYDMAIIAKELIKYQKFFDWSTKLVDYLEHTDKKREPTMLANTNKLIGKYDGLDGIKTGYHEKAGFCFVGSAKRGDMRLISVVMNAPSSNDRFEDTKKLLDYGFGFYNSVSVAKKGATVKRLKVDKGIEKEVEIIYKEDKSFLVEKGKENEISTKIILPEKIVAPVRKGQKIGTLKIYQNDVEIGEVDLLAKQEVRKIGYLDILKTLIYRLF